MSIRHQRSPQSKHKTHQSAERINQIIKITRFCLLPSLIIVSMSPHCSIINLWWWKLLLYIHNSPSTSSPSSKIIWRDIFSWIQTFSQFSDFKYFPTDQIGVKICSAVAKNIYILVKLTRMWHCVEKYFPQKKVLIHVVCFVMSSGEKKNMKKKFPRVVNDIKMSIIPFFNPLPFRYVVFCVWAYDCQFGGCLNVGWSERCYEGRVWSERNIIE